MVFGEEYTAIIVFHVPSILYESFHIDGQEDGWYNMGEDRKQYIIKVNGKEVRLMAKPIAATPILTGKDLHLLIKDVQRPDLGKEKRKHAREMLHRASNGKY